MMCDISRHSAHKSMRIRVIGHTHTEHRDFARRCGYGASRFQLHQRGCDGLNLNPEGSAQPTHPRAPCWRATGTIQARGVHVRPHSIPTGPHCHTHSSAQPPATPRPTIP